MRSVPADLAPVRLLAGGGTEYERRLLEAADLDVMPAGTSERLARTLAARNVAGAGAAEQVPRMLGAKGSTLGAWLVRLAVIGGLGGAVIGLLGERGSVGTLASREVGLSLGTAPSAAAAPATPLAPATAAASRETPPVTQPAPPATQPAPPPTPAGAAPAPRRPVAPARASRPTPPASLHRGSRGGLLEEVRLLDAARAALRAGHGEQARTTLEAYRQRFERGELTLEADVLEADLLLFQGDAEQARALAQKLRAKSGTERYRARLEQIERRAELALRGSQPARSTRGEPRGAPLGAPSAPQPGSISTGAHMEGRR